jgi:hypothetical protein
MTLFDWLNEITWNKTPWNKFTEDDHSLFLPWMVNRFISMNSKYIELVNEVQQYNLPSKQLYEYYCLAIPKQKQFFKYIKGKKLKDDPCIDLIAEIFLVSTREAREYIDNMSKEEIDSLNALHEYSKVKKTKTK